MQILRVNGIHTEQLEGQQIRGRDHLYIAGFGACRMVIKSEVNRQVSIKGESGYDWGRNFFV